MRVGKASAQPVFDDEIVSATALNRHSGEILDRALEKCVTIMRNDQAFALLRRQDAAEMTALLWFAHQILDLLHAIEIVRSGKALDVANEFEWITAFSTDDLKAMADEVYSAFVRARRGEITADEASAVIHEWRESAWAIRNPRARAALDSLSEEVLLTEPISAPATQH